MLRTLNIAFALQLLCCAGFGHSAGPETDNEVDHFLIRLAPPLKMRSGERVSFISVLAGTANHNGRYFHRGSPSPAQFFSVRKNQVERVPALSDIEVSGSYEFGEIVLAFREGNASSTLIINNREDSYLYYRDYSGRDFSKTLSGRALIVEPGLYPKLVGEPVNMNVNFAKNLVIRLAEPVEVPLHWGKTLKFDAVQMIGGPALPGEEQQILLGKIHKGMFEAQSQFGKGSTQKDDIFVRDGILKLSTYIQNGSDVQGIFISLSGPLDNSKAQIASVPYSGGPGDFPPLEIETRASSHKIEGASPSPRALVPARSRACLVLSK